MLAIGWVVWPTFAAPEAIRWLEGAGIPELSQTVNGWVAEVPKPEEGCTTKP